MPQPLDSADRKLLIAAGALLAVLAIAAAWLSPQQGSGVSLVPSSYSPAWSGAKGAFLLLQKMGYSVERWEQPPTELPPGAPNLVLILAQPAEIPASEEDRFAIRAFLDQGGRVLAAGAAAAQLLPQASGFAEDDFMGEKRHIPVQLPSGLARGAPVITMIPPVRWHPESPSHLIIYGDRNTAAVVTYQVGKGRVIWWASASPLTNAGIREEGNLDLFLNSVGPPQGVRVLWDEYFHGVRRSLWSYFALTPVPWAAAQLGLVFLAVLVTFSRRQGLAHPPAGTSRLSPLEFVDTLGELYHAAHAGSAAVRIAYQRLRFLLVRQLGMPSGAPAADLARGAGRQLGWQEQPLLDTLIRSERSMRRIDLGDAEALGLVQQIYDYIGRLELRPAEIRKRRPE
jgi:Domain of unknown function (DUF4350)